jgi:hypothetical protein
MYFLIQKIIKIPSLEKGYEDISHHNFIQDVSFYFSQLKFYMMKKSINYFCNSGPVYYKCYFTGCSHAYRNKRDITVHLRKHVNISNLKFSITWSLLNAATLDVPKAFLIKEVSKDMVCLTLIIDLLNAKRRTVLNHLKQIMLLPDTDQFILKSKLNC